MTKLKLLSAEVIAAAMLATPAMARTSHVASRHLAEDANASAFPTDRYSAFPTDRYIDRRVCIPAPRVCAFATDPWSDDNLPCEPASDSRAERPPPDPTPRAL